MANDSAQLRTWALFKSNSDWGAIVVVIPVYGSHERFVECIRSVLAHTPTDVPLLVVDDASPDERSAEFLVRLDRHNALAHNVYCVKHEKTKGFVTTANEAFERCDPADVIVLNSDCVVTAGWLEAMRSASEDSLVATVSVFTNNGTILSLPDRNRPAPALPQSLALDTVAEAIRDRSLRLRPRIPTAVGHCFLVTRRALDLSARLMRHSARGMARRSTSHNDASNAGSGMSSRTTRSYSTPALRRSH